jgi:hypothetical protein
MRYAEIIDRSPPKYSFIACVTLAPRDLAAFEAAIRGYPHVRLLGHDAIDAHRVTARIGCTSAELRHRLEQSSDRTRP